MTANLDRVVINEKLIHYLEDLSRLSLGADERIRICSDLENILAGMELLTKLDIDILPSDLASGKNKTLLRKDNHVPSFSREEILKNAPVVMGENIVVPKIVE